MGLQSLSALLSSALLDDEVRGLILAAIAALLTIGVRKLKSAQGVVLPNQDKLANIRPYINTAFEVLRNNGLLPEGQAFIVSGYRTPAEQAASGKGIKDSYHLLGQAVDIGVTNSMAAARALIAAKDVLGPVAEIIGYPGPYIQPIVHLAWEPRTGHERAPWIGVKTLDGQSFAWKDFKEQ